jgi:hypothetical protein
MKRLLFLAVFGAVLLTRNDPAAAGGAVELDLQCDVPTNAIQLGTTVDCSIDIESGAPLTGVYAIGITARLVQDPPYEVPTDALSIVGTSPPSNAEPWPDSEGWVPLGSGTLGAGETSHLVMTLEAHRPTTQGEVYITCGYVFADGGHDGSDCIFLFVPPDYDGDGCEDVDENWIDPTVGGLRDPTNFWDFFDVFTPTGLQAPFPPQWRDRSVTGLDFFAVLSRFGSSGDPGIDPLSAPPAAPAYHTSFDRGPSGGPNPWNLTAADGAITGQDFFAVLAQFGHTCA